MILTWLFLFEQAAAEENVITHLQGCRHDNSPRNMFCRGVSDVWPLSLFVPLTVAYQGVKNS